MKPIKRFLVHSDAETKQFSTCVSVCFLCPTSLDFTTSWRKTKFAHQMPEQSNSSMHHYEYVLQPFNSLFSRTTWVSRYQIGKTNLDFTGARDSEWQWHQLGHVQVCISLQTDNHASTPPLEFFYRLDALPATQPTASKHCFISMQ